MSSMRGVIAVSVCDDAEVSRPTKKGTICPANRWDHAQILVFLARMRTYLMGTFVCHCGVCVNLVKLFERVHLSSFLSCKTSKQGDITNDFRCCV